MADITTVALVAVGVGGVLLMLARRAVASTAAEELDDAAESERSYGDLAARAREVHGQTTPPGASAVTPPVLRVRVNRVVAIDWSFETELDWDSYVGWLIDHGPTGFRRDDSDEVRHSVVLVRRPTTTRVERLEVRRGGERRVDVELTVDVGVEAF